jgi:hypothetical protein
MIHPSTKNVGKFLAKYGMFLGVQIATIGVGVLTSAKINKLKSIVNPFYNMPLVTTFFDINEL